MPTRNQAEATSEKIRESKDYTSAAMRKEYLNAQRQKGLLGLIGFGLGSAVGFYFTGDVFPWNSVGFVVGFALTALYQRNEH